MANTAGHRRYLDAMAWTGGPLSQSGTLQRATLKDLVAERLRTLILDGDLAAGERVAEVAVASSFGVSRGPVREALISLAQEGLLEGLNSGGFVVRSVTQEELIELTEIRIALEQLAARQIARSCTENDLAPLQTIVDEMGAIESMPADPSDLERHRRLVELDTQFHATLCELSGNSRLLATWTSMRREISIAIRGFSPRDEDDHYRSSHQELLDSIRSLDVTTAADGVWDHLCHWTRSGGPSNSVPAQASAVRRP
jgi:DNA-binding GntR family transcriptional regulator